MIFTRIFPIIILFTIADAKCDCRTNRPIYGVNYRQGSVCPGCKYEQNYLAGYEYVVISHSFGQKVSQTVTQTIDNTVYTYGCQDPVKNCNERVYLNPNYTSIINFYRDVKLTSVTWAKSPPTAIGGTSNRDGVPPILNADEEDQIGILCRGCKYTYTVTGNTPIVLDAEFCNKVNILIGNYNVTSTTFYETFYDYPEQMDFSLTISNSFPNAVVRVKKLWFGPQGNGVFETDDLLNQINDIRDELKTVKSDKNIAIASVIIAISGVILTVICNCLIVMHYRKNIKLDYPYLNSDL